MMGGKISNTFDIHTQHERKSGVSRLQWLREKAAHHGTQEMTTENANRFLECKLEGLRTYLCNIRQDSNMCH